MAEFCNYTWGIRQKKIGGFSLGKSMGEELGTYRGFSDGISYGNIFGKLSYLDWDNHWGEKLQLREVPLMGSQDGKVM